MNIRGPIEATDWSTDCRATEWTIPRINIRGPIEALSNARMDTMRQTIPRMNIRGPIEAIMRAPMQPDAGDSADEHPRPH